MRCIGIGKCTNLYYKTRLRCGLPLLCMGGSCRLGTRFNLARLGIMLGVF